MIDCCLTSREQYFSTIHYENNLTNKAQNIIGKLVDRWRMPQGKEEITKYPYLKWQWTLNILRRCFHSSNTAKTLPDFTVYMSNKAGGL
jgi:hypothetical protein